VGVLGRNVGEYDAGGDFFPCPSNGCFLEVLFAKVREAKKP
jgi:hypothetical protein